MGTQSGLDGIGWIALSIAIFGGWNPLRAAFGAASHAYSWELTEEERQESRAAGAKVRSRPRLAQSGRLSGQQYHVKRKAAEARAKRTAKT